MTFKNQLEFWDIFLDFRDKIKDFDLRKDFIKKSFQK